MKLKKFLSSMLIILFSQNILASSLPVTGTLNILNSNPIVYGDYLDMTYTIDGNVSPKSQIYVTVVCTQGEHVAFQASVSGSDQLSIQIIDLTGQNQFFDSSMNAYCSASLIYRSQKGKNIDISNLDSKQFTVLAQ